MNGKFCIFALRYFAHSMAFFITLRCNQRCARDISLVKLLNTIKFFNTEVYYSFVYYLYQSG